jgi:Tol biopolymer transport system component
MFIHNDVAITGTSAFVYLSCQPSFITSGAHLYFDVGTTFSVAPATFTDCPYTFHSTYTASNFIHMADATSRIIFNGSSFFTTTTGLRLTTGTVLFDNRVSLQSKASSDLASTYTSPVTYINGVTTAGASGYVAWSPDGRFLAVANAVSNGSLQIFRFNGSGLPTLVGSANLSSGIYSALWSPDGRFIVVTGASGGSYLLEVLSVIGGVPSSSPVGIVTFGASIYNFVPSPDGRFIAGLSSGLQIYSFNGFMPILFASNPSVTGDSVNWSPDGRFIAVTDVFNGTFQIYGASTLVQVGGNANTGPSPSNSAWSPDGRFIVVTNVGFNNRLEIFSFNGSNTPLQVGNTVNTGINPQHASWSPDGRFFAIVNNGSNTLEIFSFNGSSTPVQVGGNVNTGPSPSLVSWSPDGRFIAVVCGNSSLLQIFSVNYIVSQTPQALSNSIVFGNSALGSSYDATVDFLSGSNVMLNGQLNLDNVN